MMLRSALRLRLCAQALACSAIGGSAGLSVGLAAFVGLSAGLTASSLAMTSGSGAGHSLAPAPTPQGWNAELARRTLSSLASAFPGVRVGDNGQGAGPAAGRVAVLYGTQMASAPTARLAANAFLNQFRAAFGAGQVTLELTSIDEIDQGRFTLFNYVQTLDGLPVELSLCRVLVLNPDQWGGGAVQQPTVVLVSAKLAEQSASTPQTPDGFPPIAVTAEDAIKSVQAMREFGHLPEWTKPELCVYFAEGDESAFGGTWIQPVRAYRFVGSNPVPKWAQKRTFFVDAATGKLVFARNDILHGPGPISGVVRGNISPGLLPDTAANPPQPAVLRDIRVTTLLGGGTGGAGGTAGPIGFTDPTGAFTFTGLAAGNVNFLADLTTSRWFKSFETGGTVINASVDATSPLGAPNSADILLNPTPTEVTTAQLNGLYHANRTRDFVRSRAPSFTGLDTSSSGIPIQINTSVVGNCNAFYDGVSLNFFRAANGCPNTAYADVVSHEYGHHVVNRRGLAQGAFGEGYSDSLALWSLDTFAIGPGFFGPGTFLRRPDTVNQQFPCTSTAIHTCGQIIGGTMYEYKELLKSSYGAEAGLAFGRQQFINWTLVTAGGQGLNSAHPQTAIELLTLDDTDGNISNGTPNYSLIASAFQQHGIAVPVRDAVTFNYPSGVPTQLIPNQPTPVRVVISASTASPLLQTATLLFRVPPAGTNGTAGGPFSEIPMTLNGDNSLTASIPAQACRTRVDFIVRVDTNSGLPAFSPRTAPVPTSIPFTAVAGSGTERVRIDDFEIDSGWARAATGDTATTGQWIRMAPGETLVSSSPRIVAQPGADTTPAPGVNCWVTDGNPGTSAGSFDIDGGFTTLISAPLALASLPDATIRYNAWLFATGTDDSLTVDISADGSTNWVRVETILGTGGSTSGEWSAREFRVGNFIIPTDQTRLRFRATDVGTPTLVEAAIDDLEIRRVLCPAACLGDFNNSGGVSTQDIFDFLAAWFSNDPRADINATGGVTVQDIFDFLAAFFAGC